MVEAESDCRLYLQLPGRPSATLEQSLATALADADVACVLLLGEGAPSEEAWELRLRALTREREVAFLIDNDAERAERIGADGIHIAPDPARYRSARARLGPSAIIGAGPLETRHEAMLMAELGADYVAFGAAREARGPAPDRRAEMIAWWSEIFVVPCVAWDVESAEAAERLARLGADFVALDTGIWEAEGAAKRIASLDAALHAGRTAA
jgi:thiamine-phosphate pyrophosphorylase